MKARLARIFLVSTVLFLAAAGIASAAGAKRPTPPLPDAEKAALFCQQGELYFVAAPDLGNWKGEVRGNCYYSNYCYTHAGLSIHAEQDTKDPGQLLITFSGAAKRYMDYCGSLYCERRKVGKAWYTGQIAVPLADVSKAKYVSYKYHTNDIFYPGHHDEDRSSDQPGCQWRKPWGVVDNNGRAGE